MALVNERSIPFQLAANDFGVVVTYAPATKHYEGEISCSDINAQKGKSAVVRSKLDLSVEAAPDESISRLSTSPPAKPAWRLQAV